MMDSISRQRMLLSLGAVGEAISGGLAQARRHCKVSKNGSQGSYRMAGSSITYAPGTDRDRNLFLYASAQSYRYCFTLKFLTQ